MGVRTVKYLAALLFSVVLLPLLMSRTETILFWRKVIYKEEPKEYRKKQYKRLLVFWAIVTVAAFIFVIFFLD